MSKTLQIVDDLVAFHRAGEVVILDTLGFPDEDCIELRKSLIREEVGETLSAIDSRDMIEVADGIADSIVVLVGTALSFGIDLTAVWNEVQRSNMAKFPQCKPCLGTGLHDGHGAHYEKQCTVCHGRGTQLILREDGKILKPKGWTPPDIAGILGLENE